MDFHSELHRCVGFRSSDDEAVVLDRLVVLWRLPAAEPDDILALSQVQFAAEDRPRRDGQDIHRKIDRSSAVADVQHWQVRLQFHLVLYRDLLAHSYFEMEEEGFASCIHTLLEVISDADVVIILLMVEPDAVRISTECPSSVFRCVSI